MSELVVIEKATALQLFVVKDAIDPVLKRIREEIDEFKPDVSTAKGREAIASMAYKIARSKTYLDGIGKELSEAQSEIPKKIDATRKDIRLTLDRWKEEVRAPLNQWEENEEKRKRRHENNISVLKSYTFLTSDKSPDYLRSKLAEIPDEIPQGSCEEYHDQYVVANEAARAHLQSVLIAAEKREADAAALKEIKAKLAEEQRLRKEAEEAEAKAKAERDKAEQEAADAEALRHREAELAERARLLEKKAAEEREAKLRDEANRAKLAKEESDRRAAETEKRLRDEAKLLETRRDHIFSEIYVVTKKYCQNDLLHRELIKRLMDNEVPYMKLVLDKP